MVNQGPGGTSPFTNPSHPNLCPGAGKQWSSSAPNHSDEKPLPSLWRVELCTERRGEQYPTPSLRRGPEQDKQIQYKTSSYSGRRPLTCHRTHDEPHSCFLPTQQHTEEDTTPPREEKDPIFGQGPEYLARDQSHHLQTPSKHFYQ